MDAKQETIRRWILEMWGAGKIELIDELASPDYVYHAPGTGEVRGRQALKELVAYLRTVFPDLNNTIEDQFVSGNKVATRGVTRGTQKAAMGNVPPTGRTVAVNWIMISRFEGRAIREDYEIWDGLVLLQDLGAYPKPS